MDYNVIEEIQNVQNIVNDICWVEC